MITYIETFGEFSLYIYIYIYIYMQKGCSILTKSYMRIRQLNTKDIDWIQWQYRRRVPMLEFIKLLASSLTFDIETFYTCHHLPSTIRIVSIPPHTSIVKLYNTLHTGLIVLALSNNKWIDAIIVKSTQHLYGDAVLCLSVSKKALKQLIISMGHFLHCL